MKRCLSITLIAFVMLQQYAFAAVQEKQSNDIEYTIYSEDFESLSDGQTIDASFETDAEAIAVIGVSGAACDEGAGIAMKLQEGNSRYTYKFANNAVTGDTISVTFDYMQPNSGEVTNLFTLYPSGRDSMLSCVSANDGYLYIDGQQIFDYAENQWYSIRLDYNIKNETVDIYIGNESLGEKKLPIGENHYITEEQKDQISEFEFRTKSAEFYVDNINIKGSESKTKWYNDIEMIEEAVSFENSITPAVVRYSEQMKDALSTAISQARSECENASTVDELETAVAALKTVYSEYVDSAEYEFDTVFEGHLTEDTLSDWTTIGSVQGMIDPTGVKTNVIAGLDASAARARLIKDPVNTADGNYYTIKSSFMQEEKSEVEEVLNLYAYEDTQNWTTNMFNIYSDGTDLRINCYDSPDRGVTDPTVTSFVNNKVLVENYETNKWYDFDIEINTQTREIKISVNGERVLENEDVYFVGGNVSEQNFRLAYRIESGQAYVADMGIYSNKSLAVVDSLRADLSELSDTFSGWDGYGDVIESESLKTTTDSGATVTWRSGADNIAQYTAATGDNNWYITFPRGAGSVDVTADMIATVTHNGYSADKVFELQINKAYRGTIIDESFDYENGILLTAIDPNFQKIGQTDAFVQDNTIFFGQDSRYVYNIPKEKRPADVEIIEFQFMQPVSGAVGHILDVTDDNGSTLGPCFSSDGTNLRINRRGDGDITIFENYEPNVWYSVKLIMNFETRTFDVLIDNENVCSETVIRDQIRNIGRLSFSKDTVSGFYIDNLKVYTDMELTTDIKLYDGDLEISKFDDITGNSLSAKISFINENQESMDIDAYIAVYDGDELYNVRSAHGNILSTDSTKTIEVQDVSLPDNKTNVKIKCFVWDDMRPIIEPKVFEKKELEDYTIACWGDSITHGDGATAAQSYPSVLAELSGAQVYNMGIGGETATTIAARQGGLDIVLSGGFELSGEAGSQVTFYPENFKASNGVTVIPRDVSIGGWNPCTINGIEGTLSAEVDTSVAPRKLISATFTRRTSGEPLSVPADESAVLITEASKLQADINVIYIGVNGDWGPNNANDVNELIDTIDSMIAHAESDKYIVIGLTTKNDAERNDLDAALSEKYGPKFLNIRKYLSDEKTLQDLGIEATDSDLKCIEEGQVPSSFWASPTDSTHMNADGYKAFANCVYDKLLELYSPY